MQGPQHFGLLSICTSIFFFFTTPSVKFMTCKLGFSVSHTHTHSHIRQQCQRSAPDLKVTVACLCAVAREERRGEAGALNRSCTWLEPRLSSTSGFGPYHTNTTHTHYTHTGVFERERYCLSLSLSLSRPVRRSAGAFHCLPARLVSVCVLCACKESQVSPRYNMMTTRGPKETTIVPLPSPLPPRTTLPFHPPASYEHT